MKSEESSELPSARSFREDHHAAKLRSTNLPGVDESEAPNPFSKSHFLSENHELSDFTPSQLYELNQNLFDMSVPERPLIDDVAPISVLRAEYESGSPSFVKQIDFLKQSRYTKIRRTRGDGDCFYRSLAFAYVERLLHVPDRELAVATALSNLEAVLPMLKKAGFQDFVYDDFYESFASTIKQIATSDPVKDVLTLAKLLQDFQNPEVSNSIVVFLRLVTSAKIRTETESFAPFLFNPDLGLPMEPREFCESYVEAVGKEADHVQITALSQSLQLDINIAYLDGHGADGRVNFVEFHNASVPGTDPLILLYRPGHYDILAREDGPQIEI